MAACRKHASESLREHFRALLRFREGQEGLVTGGRAIARRWLRPYQCCRQQQRAEHRRTGDDVPHLFLAMRGHDEASFFSRQNFCQSLRVRRTGWTVSVLLPTIITIAPMAGVAGVPPMVVDDVCRSHGRSVCHDFRLRHRHREGGRARQDKCNCKCDRSKFHSRVLSCGIRSPSR